MIFKIIVGEDRVQCGLAAPKSDRVNRPHGYFRIDPVTVVADNDLEDRPLIFQLVAVDGWLDQTPDQLIVNAGVIE